MPKKLEHEHLWAPFTKWKAECSVCNKHSTWDEIVAAATHRGFVQGIAYSVAEIVRSHDQPTIAVDLAGAAGFDYDDFAQAGVDEFDLKQLRKLRREEQRFPRKRRA